MATVGEAEIASYLEEFEGVFTAMGTALLGADAASLNRNDYIRGTKIVHLSTLNGLAIEWAPSETRSVYINSSNAQVVDLLSMSGKRLDGLRPAFDLAAGFTGAMVSEVVVTNYRLFDLKPAPEQPTSLHPAITFRRTWWGDGGSVHSCPFMGRSVFERRLAELDPRYGATASICRRRHWSC